jgi:hypothetical protein
MTTLSDYQPSPELWALLTLIAGGVGRFFYDLIGIPIPEGGEQFIFWSSASGEPRPEDGPQHAWA